MSETKIPRVTHREAVISCILSVLITIVTAALMFFCNGNNCVSFFHNFGLFAGIGSIGTARLLCRIEPHARKDGSETGAFLMCLINTLVRLEQIACIVAIFSHVAMLAAGALRVPTAYSPWLVVALLAAGGIALGAVVLCSLRNLADLKKAIEEADLDGDLDDTDDDIK